MKQLFRHRGVLSAAISIVAGLSLVLPHDPFLEWVKGGLWIIAMIANAYIWRGELVTLLHHVSATLRLAGILGRSLDELIDAINRVSKRAAGRLNTARKATKRRKPEQVPPAQVQPVDEGG